MSQKYNYDKKLFILFQLILKCLKLFDDYNLSREKNKKYIYIENFQIEFK